MEHDQIIETKYHKNGQPLRIKISQFISLESIATSIDKITHSDGFLPNPILFATWLLLIFPQGYTDPELSLKVS